MICSKSKHCCMGLFCYLYLIWVASIIHRIATYLQQLIIYLQRPPRQAAQNGIFSQWQFGSIKNTSLEAAKWVILFMCFYQHEGHAATLCGARVMEHKRNQICHCLRNSRPSICDTFICMLIAIFEWCHLKSWSTIKGTQYIKSLRRITKKNHSSFNTFQGDGCIVIFVGIIINC